MEKNILACVVVDVEEEFDWNKPFSSSNHNVTALLGLPPAQEIFARHGFIPAYLITYPIAVSEEGRRAFIPILERGSGIIGAQLHPWVTPPIVEKITAKSSYVCNLPAKAEEEKIKCLVEAIRENFGIKPEIYRAGRYGFDLSRSNILLDQGFKIDTSIMPNASYFEQDSGPDFFDWPEEPFWLNRTKQLLEIPSTQGLVGTLNRTFAPSALRCIYTGRLNRLHLPGILSRLGLLERLRLSPEGFSFEEMKKLVDSRIEQGASILCLTFHSPSLAAGFTPYVHNQRDLTIFFERLEKILHYLVETVEAKPVSLLEIHKIYATALDSPDEIPSTPPSIYTSTSRGSSPNTSMTRRILFISGYSPPNAPIGAVRNGEIVTHWRNQSFDVRTIAIDIQDMKHGKGTPSSSVHYLPYSEPGHFVTNVVSQFRSRFLRPEDSVTRGSDRANTDVENVPPPSNFISFRKIYRDLIMFPDRYRSWITPAVKLALSWSTDWQPDIIYSSGPPQSGHVVASRLSRQLGAPWIAELRDLWAGNPYEDHHPLIEPFYDTFARRTLSGATACVALTNLASARIQTLTQKPALVSYNGHNPDDFKDFQNVEPLDRSKLTILHAGIIYPGRRDPTPLFEAIAALGENGRDIRCLFYHDENGAVARLAKLFRIEECVEIHDAIPRKEILLLERQVDILLECRWIDSAGDIVIPGKLFEYIGARRPILSIGSLTGESPDIIRDNNFGLVSNDAAEISSMLLDALGVKEKLGRLPDLNQAAAALFERKSQFQKIDSLIERVLADGNEA